MAGVHALCVRCGDIPCDRDGFEVGLVEDRHRGREYSRKAKGKAMLR